jgi:hypothetical protein
LTPKFKVPMPSPRRHGTYCIREALLGRAADGVV